MTTTDSTDTTGKPATHDGAYRGRRISWREFYRMRPDLRPDNDNERKVVGAASILSSATSY